MKFVTITTVSSIIFLAACGTPTHNATLISMKDGKAVYATSGLVMVSAFSEGVTKPYAEAGLQGACPDGLIYHNYEEAINKHVPAAVWVQWAGEVECK